jgi:hypothetical protein
MSKITLVSPASGTAEFSITTPSGTSTDRTLTLPDAGGTVVSDTATQTLTNKTIQGGALTLATAVASTSGTSIDFTSIPSWVKRITVMLNGVSTNGSAAYLIQLGDAGGVETTGYTATALYVSVTSNTTRAGFYTTGFGLSWSTGAAGEVNTATLTFVNTNGNNWNGMGMQNYSTNSGGHFISGQKTLSDVLTQVRITTTNGTDAFDLGTINIMYEG